MEVFNRFLRYVSYDTQSSDSSAAAPSTEKQLALGRELVRELTEIGVPDAAISQHGIVTGTVPATEQGRPVLGFVAHYDTSPDCSGKDVKPRLIRAYDGADIVLDAEGMYVMRAQDDASLRAAVGQDLIVTDGTTLLGADDKAGVAEIMAMAQELLAHPEWKHGAIRIGFTPDEEVGRGTEHFDVAAFGADFAYTVDGGPVGELEYENFNAAMAIVTTEGFSIHPGSAKNKLVNASKLAMEFHALLPPALAPEHTEGYEGFLHLLSIEGGVERCRMEYLLRDHDAEKLASYKALLRHAAEFLNKSSGAQRVHVTIKDAYRNMKEQIAPHMHLIEDAKAAMERLGIVPEIKPIRGGTDGANLSYMGLPCPNLGTGGSCAHGKFEHITVQDMERVARLLIELALAARG